MAAVTTTGTRSFEPPDEPVHKPAQMTMNAVWAGKTGVDHMIRSDGNGGNEKAIWDAGRKPGSETKGEFAQLEDGLWNNTTGLGVPRRQARVPGEG